MVLCPPTQLVPLAAAFVAQIIVFDLKFPLTAGAAVSGEQARIDKATNTIASKVELYHHSKDTPATISKLEATLDKASGEVIKRNPRMLSSGVSARVVVKLRSSQSSTNKAVIPIEPFSVNKAMGRILLRRGGETVAAGIVLEIVL